MRASEDATTLLKRLCAGESDARDAFAPLLHDELRKIAKHHLARERANHTLAPTELVHDAWIRLIRPEIATFENRRQFFALASTMMRSLLVDHARMHRAERRGGGLRPITLKTDAEPSERDHGEDVVALDDALRRLAEIDGDLARIAELKLFGAVEMSEVALLLDIPQRTAERRWAVARTWLRKELGDG
jgi:RNA polymerase sigma-70 factor, ECF subfamily